MSTAAASTSKVDVAFAASGTPVPLDHGYLLFGALARVLGDLHGASWLAIHPLRGRVLGPDKLRLAQHEPALVLRVTTERIGDVMRLSGKTLEVGPGRIHVGTPSIRMLRPAPELSARMVTFKHHLTEETFLPHAIGELEKLGVQGDLTPGRRRVITVAGDTIVGFGLRIGGLSAEASLRLQNEGLGGRRRFGCGVLVPAAEHAPRTSFTG